MENTQTDLELYMIEYNELLRKIRLLEEKKDDLRSKILIHVKLNDIEEHEVDGIVLSLTSQKRKSLDKINLEKFLNKHDSSIIHFEIENTIEMLRIQDKVSLEKHKNQTNIQEAQ